MRAICKLLLLALVNMLIVLEANPTLAATTPKDDFVSWYREWSTNLPRTYKTTYKQIFKHPANSPLVMTISDWQSGEYRLCSIDNSDTKRAYRSFSNNRYGASIESTSDAGPIWTLRKYAPRGERGFQKILEAGSEPLLLGPSTIFDTNVSTRIVESDGANPEARQVEISFPKDASTKPRDPQTIVATLAPSVGWMPTEIKISEFGGASTRKVIDGWRAMGEAWVYNRVTSYYKPSKSEAEVIHSIQDWEFVQAEQQRDHEAECFLRFYGLPEPAGSDWLWRALIFVAAAVLLSMGYVLLKRQQIHAR